MQTPIRIRIFRSSSRVAGIVTVGYFFGNIPFIKQNLTLVIFGIVLLSILPGIVGYLRHRAA